MKKNLLKNLNLKGVEQLTKEQLKNVFGGRKAPIEETKCPWQCAVSGGGVLPCCQSSGSASIDLYDSIGIEVDSC
ncbi:hypothetical protein [Sphingobacterium sp. xlx-130]|uniref:hypothetical protein n=1 Tax=Sphingobacterium sp. xlx-130 TaxID=2654323 RepID=UPI0013D94F3A|nr:hypothetical protein [Sphingobacterium sp. xlx-130]